MRSLLLIGAASALALSAVAAQAATKLEIRDAVARVVVIPEARGDVKVEVQKRHPGLPMRMWVEGDTVKIDGDLGHNAIRNCHGMGGAPTSTSATRARSNTTTCPCCWSARRWT
jgi:uncharacterized protein (DUF2141 family)